MSRGTSKLDPCTQGAGPGSADVIAWRRRRLLQAGLEERVAASFAADRRMDLHALLDLIDRGCPPQVAARILAPLEPPDPGAA